MHIISQIPLVFIVFIGSIIEEIIPPLPSPLLIIITDIAKSSQPYSLIYLFAILAIVTLGKTVGALLLYVLGDKGEKIAISHLGKFLDISHSDVKNIGA